MAFYGLRGCAHVHSIQDERRATKFRKVSGVCSGRQQAEKLTQEVHSRQDGQRGGNASSQEELSKAEGAHNGTQLACRRVTQVLHSCSHCASDAGMQGA